MHVLGQLVKDLARRIEAAPMQAGEIDVRKATPDQLLDTSVAVRGAKAEAHLFGKIARRRVARAHAAAVRWRAGPSKVGGVLS